MPGNPPAAPTTNRAAIGLVDGGSATYYGIPSVMRPVNMAEHLVQWYKEEYPTASVAMQTGRLPTKDTVFYWLEDKEVPHWVTYTGPDAYTSTAPVFASDYTRLQNYDMLFNPRAGDWAIVSGFGTVDEDVDVIRGIGGPAASWNTNDKIIVYSNAYPEGSSSGTAITAEQERKSGNVQFMRDVTETTHHLAAVPLYTVEGRDQRKLQQAKMFTKHKARISNTMWFGTAAGDYTSTTSAAWEHNVSAGVFGLTGAQRWKVNGPMYWNDMRSFLSGPMRWTGNNTCILATSSHVINVITDWGESALRINQNDKEWGMEFTSIIVNGRKVALFREGVFDEDPYLAKCGVFLCPKNAKWRPHIGNINLDTKFYPDIKKDDGNTTFKDEIRTTGGWQLQLEASFGIMTDIEF